MLTNTYDAQFGRTGGGTVNVTLHSGANSWHGTAFEYFHNAILDANASETTVREWAAVSITPANSAALPGARCAVINFRLLQLRRVPQIAPAPVVSDTPPASLRDGQHFSSYGVRIYVPPLHERAAMASIPRGISCFSTYIRSPFPGNIIPPSRISPIGSAILALYPLPNGPGLTQNYVNGANTGLFGYVANCPMGPQL